MTNYEELKRLALAATPVDMDLYGDRYAQGSWSRADFSHEQDAFYRAANPAVILDLLDVIDKLTAEKNNG